MFNVFLKQDTDCAIYLFTDLDGLKESYEQAQTKFE